MEPEWFRADWWFFSRTPITFALLGNPGQCDPISDFKIRTLQISEVNEAMFEASKRVIYIVYSSV